MGLTMRSGIGIMHEKYVKLIRIGSVFNVVGLFDPIAPVIMAQRTSSIWSEIQIAR